MGLLLNVRHANVLRSRNLQDVWNTLSWNLHSAKQWLHFCNPCCIHAFHLHSPDLNIQQLQLWAEAYHNGSSLHDGCYSSQKVWYCSCWLQPGCETSLILFVSQSVWRFIFTKNSHGQHGVTLPLDAETALGRGFEPRLDHAVCRSCNSEVRVRVLWASF